MWAGLKMLDFSPLPPAPSLAATSPSPLFSPLCRRKRQCMCEDCLLAGDAPCLLPSQLRSNSLPFRIPPRLCFRVSQYRHPFPPLFLLHHSDTPALLCLVRIPWDAKWGQAASGCLIQDAVLEWEWCRNHPSEPNLHDLT